ncbi:MAG: hypothetical protein H7235_08615 [Bdellovibrionaceae bacterium]|nr:hypothetical protein [Pseudobdellovibrionaceae bacterium]
MLVVAGLSSVVVLGTSSIFVNSIKAESVNERQFWLAARRMGFQSLIRSTNGWNAILANNPNMACFAAGTGCAAFSTSQPLVLSVDTDVLDGASNTNGMNNKGDFCNNFNVTNGDSSCPVGIKLNWVALCDDAACLRAQPKITIRFQTKEVGGPLIDLKSYDLIVFKDPKLESLNEVCTAMDGVLVGTICNITSLASACDPANSSFPLGFDNTGNVICGKPNPGACSASDVATGFDAQGGILCAPACL